MTMTPFTVGGPTAHSSLVARFAIDQGLFEQAGIDARVQIVHGGPELAKAYDSGAIGMGEMGSPPAITAIAQGRRFRIIGSSMRRGVALFFATVPGVERIEQLKGRTVGALSRGSCSDWYLREALSQHGVDPDRDVDVRGLGADHEQVLELFGSGEIAAALLSGLNVAMGEARGVLRNWGAVFDVARVPNLQWSVYVASQTFLAEHGDLAQRAFRVLRQAGAQIAARPEQWCAFLAERFGISREMAETVHRAEKPFLHFDGRLDLEGLACAVDVQHRLGAIERVPEIDALIDRAFIDAQYAGAAQVEQAG
ncbi:MAG: ABC transporter substrate-binding protein [Burkholderiaceae bacterium]